MKFSPLVAALRAAFARPTLKQKEAYGRFAHTLAAAAVIGQATILFADNAALASAWRITGLAVGGVICFVAGALLTRGE